MATQIANMNVNISATEDLVGHESQTAKFIDELLDPDDNNLMDGLFENGYINAVHWPNTQTYVTASNNLIPQGFPNDIIIFQSQISLRAVRKESYYSFKHGILSILPKCCEKRALDPAHGHRET
jgi:hypothetical protein